MAYPFPSWHRSNLPSRHFAAPSAGGQDRRHRYTYEHKRNPSPETHRAQQKPPSRHPSGRALAPARTDNEIAAKRSKVSVVAESIRRLAEVCERIGDSRREQMAEMERMRKGFCLDLEAQKQRHLEQVEAAIASVRREADGDEDGGAREAVEDYVECMWVRYELFYPPVYFR